MPWFLACLMTHSPANDGGAVMVRSREYWCVVLADDNDAAYQKSLSLRGKILNQLSPETDGRWVVDGVSTLLALANAPAAGGEILWERADLYPSEVDERIKSKEFLRVFSSEADSQEGSDWYLCELIFAEVHDTGTHGDTVLVWVNSYLIEAPDKESAYSLAAELGSREALELGSHRCEGDSAHWEFRGLRDMARLLEAPGDGAILWFDERILPLDDVRGAVPSPATLGLRHLDLT